MVATCYLRRINSRATLSRTFTVPALSGVLLALLDTSAAGYVHNSIHDPDSILAARRVCILARSTVAGAKQHGLIAHPQCLASEI